MLRAHLSSTSRLNLCRSSSTRLGVLSPIKKPQFCGNSQLRSLQTNSEPAQDLHEFGEQHVTKGLSRITKGIMTKGDGSWVTYDDGRKMLDFTCGIAVTNLGHSHPKVSKAAADQCMQLVHSQCSIAMHEPYLRLIEKLLPAMPHPSLDSFFFWNSGSEAVEAAIKMARQVTGKQNIISMQGAYHGRTFGAMALTKSKTIYSAGTHPLMPGVFSIPFPYWHQQNQPVNTPLSTLTEDALYQLELLLAQQTSAAETAAIIVEPVLGEGGYVPAPPEFLQGLRKICDKNKILLIIDEIQSGFCRTGTWFAIEESGVRPDILIMAKGLGNGFPISGVVSRRELTDKLKPGSMGGTYAGNAVSCAAAVAVANSMRDEKILENVQARSTELFSALNGLKYDPALNPHILDVRGRGLMVGLEFASPAATAHRFSAHAASDLPDAPPPPPHSTHSAQKGVKHPKGMAARVARKCIDKGMLILTTSVYEVIRFIPPLNVTKEEMKKGTEIFAESVREVVKEG
ncbi:acetylornithine aminotransferase [Crepidotus variabilis]|uniref:Acetylornithine aminotransferase n=1 Tax=Crepidotus variabilis TaxID=179855 RepID=A0A9P6E5D7_9AGAR|nr:acetylornithine aminotransferase [Crepidotus variabilis]